MKEKRVDADRLRADRREALTEWVRSLGIDPNDVRPTVVIRQAEHEYELHLSRFKRDGTGRLIVDTAANNVVSEPLVIALGTEQCWPNLIGFGVFQ